VKLGARSSIGASTDRYKADAYGLHLNPDTAEYTVCSQMDDGANEHPHTSNYHNTTERAYGAKIHA